MTKAKWVRIAEELQAKWYAIGARIADLTAAAASLNQAGPGVPLTVQDAQTIKEVSAQLQQLQAELSQLDLAIHRHTALADAWA